MKTDRNGDLIEDAWQYGVMYDDGSVSRRWNGRTQEDMARLELKNAQAKYPSDNIRLVKRWIGRWIEDAKEPPEHLVIEAAVMWVERITSRPGQWADDEDLELIKAVKELTGVTYSWEKS